MSREEFLGMFREDVIRLSRYITWFEKKSGNDVSKYYEDGDKMRHTLSFPVYDSILLSFLNDASTTVFMEQNYHYFYTRNHIMDYEDELRMIETADIMHMEVLQCILSRYIFGGMTKAYLWKDGVDHKIFLNILKKARQIVEFWDQPIVVEDDVLSELEEMAMYENEEFSGDGYGEEAVESAETEYGEETVESAEAGYEEETVESAEAGYGEEAVESAEAGYEEAVESAEAEYGEETVESAETEYGEETAESAESEYEEEAAESAEAGYEEETVEFQEAECGEEAEVPGEEGESEAEFGEETEILTESAEETVEAGYEEKADTEEMVDDECEGEEEEQEEVSRDEDEKEIESAVEIEEPEEPADTQENEAEETMDEETDTAEKETE